MVRCTSTKVPTKRSLTRLACSLLVWLMSRGILPSKKSSGSSLSTGDQFPAQMESAGRAWDWKLDELSSTMPPPKSRGYWAIRVRRFEAYWAMRIVNMLRTGHTLGFLGRRAGLRLQRETCASRVEGDYIFQIDWFMTAWIKKRIKWNLASWNVRMSGG